MFSVLFLSFILVYFWYFYHFRLKPLVQPSTTAPHKHTKFEPLFVAKAQNAFEFVLHHQVVWEHKFPDDSYLVKADTRKIIERDDCYNYLNTVRIPATGLSLYKYLKKISEFPEFSDFKKGFLPTNSLLDETIFKQDSPYTTQQGNVFYFTCVDRHINRLDQCPSGTLFQNQVCVDISTCTGQPDHTTLSLPSDPTHFIQCKNGREFIKQCPPHTFFLHDQCVDQDDEAYVCQWHETTLPRKLNATTMVECQHYTPVYTTCPPGTEILGNPQSLKDLSSPVCEPADCSHLPDGTHLPLKKRVVKPFHFIPGYMECRGNRVVQTVDCPNSWDSMLSKGDDLTHLPMVFDGQQCTIPTWGENVFSDDPEVIVPVHEFTKHVRNWSLSEHYDRMAGYVWTPSGSRKRKRLDPGMRIGKQFKMESACLPQGRVVLPVEGEPTQFYDCGQHVVGTCPPGDFFNGDTCTHIPPYAFQYRNVPLFHFDSLNSEGWMQPWDFPGKDDGMLPGCRSADYRFLPHYNLCTHPECEKFAFLSMIPELSILLPQEHQAQCTFHEVDRHLTQTPIQARIRGISFWDQKILPEKGDGKEACTWGQNLKTGHFVWDTTIFATCDSSQPFVFCPSVHSQQGLVRQGDVHACAPPTGNVIAHPFVNQWIGYASNEVKRILPAVWDGSPYTFFMNRTEAVPRHLLETGFEVPRDERLNLFVDRPVNLELHYRVTFPPNVGLEYDDRNDLQIHTSDSSHAFHVRNENFSHLRLKFPRYQVQEYVQSFLKSYHP